MKTLEDCKAKLSALSRNLVAKSLKLEQTNALLEEISLALQNYDSAKDQSGVFTSLKNKIRYILMSENEWSDITLQFEIMHPGFYERLLSQYPDLTPNELKHCAFMKMNLDRKETAKIMNITINAVRNARNRLSKKMKLPTGARLNNIIPQI